MARFIVLRTEGVGTNSKDIQMPITDNCTVQTVLKLMFNQESIALNSELYTVYAFGFGYELEQNDQFCTMNTCQGEIYVICKQSVTDTDHSDIESALKTCTDCRKLKECEPYTYDGITVYACGECA